MDERGQEAATQPPAPRVSLAEAKFRTQGKEGDSPPPSSASHPQAAVSLLHAFIRRVSATATKGPRLLTRGRPQAPRCAHPRGSSFPITATSTAGPPFWGPAQMRGPLGLPPPSPAEVSSSLSWVGSALLSEKLFEGGWGCVHGKARGPAPWGRSPRQHCGHQFQGVPGVSAALPGTHWACCSPDRQTDPWICGGSCQMFERKLGVTPEPGLGGGSAHGTLGSAE